MAMSASPLATLLTRPIVSLTLTLVFWTAAAPIGAQKPATPSISE